MSRCPHPGTVRNVVYSPPSLLRISMLRFTLGLKTNASAGGWKPPLLGLRLSGLRLLGLWLSGLWLSGLWLSGLWLSGLWLSGLWLLGLRLSGLRLLGLWLLGLRLSVLKPLDLFQNCKEIVRQWSFEGHRFFAYGVGQL